MNWKNIKDVFTFQWELKHRKSKAGVEGITASLTSLPLNVNCRTWSTFQAEAEEVFNVGDILNCRIRQLTSFPFPFIRWTWIQHEKEMAWSAPVFRCVETKPLRAPLFVYWEACLIVECTATLRSQLAHDNYFGFLCVTIFASVQWTAFIPTVQLLRNKNSKPEWSVEKLLGLGYMSTEYSIKNNRL